MSEFSEMKKNIMAKEAELRMMKENMKLMEQNIQQEREDMIKSIVGEFVSMMPILMDNGIDIIGGRNSVSDGEIMQEVNGNRYSDRLEVFVERVYKRKGYFSIDNLNQYDSKSPYYDDSEDYLKFTFYAPLSDFSQKMK